MNRRILVNLVLFGVLSVALGKWAVDDVLQLDITDPPYEITADFEDSPGLQPGYDVGYLGTPIGRIRAVELADGHVEVTLAIDAGQSVPEGSSFAVRRKSAVGEPYVDVIPPAGAEADGPAMAEGDHVPVERTRTPLSYSDLFESLDDLVAAVPEDDLAVVFDEMARAVDGRAGSLRDLVTGSDDALATFAADAELLERSTRNLSRLARVFARHRHAIGEGLDNTEAVTGSLAAARADLERVLVDGSSLADRTADLLDEAGADLSCTFGSLATVVVSLDRAEVHAALESLLASAPAAARVFRDVIAWEADGPYVRAVPPLNVGGTDPVPVYPEPRELPAVSDPTDCPALGTPTAPGGAGDRGPGGAGEIDAGPTPAVDPGAPIDADGEEASSDRPTGGGGFNPLLLVLALLGVALVAAVRPWRFLTRDH